VGILARTSGLKVGGRRLLVITAVKEGVRQSGERATNSTPEPHQLKIPSWSLGSTGWNR
jgi:hypothetical protein